MNMLSESIFFLEKSKVDDRIDPIYYLMKSQLIDNFNYPLSKLGHSFDIKDGDHDALPENAKDRVNKTRRYLRAQDLKDNTIIEERPVYVTEEYFQSVKRCHIYPGDLLFSIMASLGATAIVPKDFPICTANRAVGILRLKPESVFIPEYVQAFLNTDLGFSLLEIQKRGGIQQRINLTDLYHIKIPKPSFEEQNMIIEIYNAGLEKKAELINAANEVINSIGILVLEKLNLKLPNRNDKITDRIFKVDFSSVAGNRLDPFYSEKIYQQLYESIVDSENPTKLNDIISFLESGSRPPGGASNINEGILSFGGEHVNNKCEIEVKKEKFIPVEYHQNNLKTETKMYDIILVKDGATTGKIGIITKPEHVGQNVNEHVYIIRTNERCNPFYLMNYLASEIGQLQIKRIITGATVTGLTKDVVKRLLIPLPSTEIQEEIVEKINEKRAQADILFKEAETVLKEAKKEVENLILVGNV